MSISLEIPLANRLAIVVNNLVTPTHSCAVEFSNSVCPAVQEEVLALPKRISMCFAKVSDQFWVICESWRAAIYKIIAFLKEICLPWLGRELGSLWSKLWFCAIWLAQF